MFGEIIYKQWIYSKPCVQFSTWGKGNISDEHFPALMFTSAIFGPIATCGARSEMTRTSPYVCCIIVTSRLYNSPPYMRETFFLQNFLEGKLTKNTLNVKISRNDSKIRAKTTRQWETRPADLCHSFCPFAHEIVVGVCGNPVGIPYLWWIFLCLLLPNILMHIVINPLCCLVGLYISFPLVAIVRACFVSPGIPSQTWRRWRRLLRCWLRIQWQRWTTSLSSIGTRWDGMKTLMAGYRPNMKHVWS